MEVVEGAQHALTMRHRRHLIAIPRDGLPDTAFTRAAAGATPDPGAPPVRYRQCGRVGLTITCNQRQKSRASTWVTWSQPTPSAHKNRNQRNRSIPYERCVVAGRPHAANSAKNAAAGATTPPPASTSRYG